MYCNIKIGFLNTRQAFIVNIFFCAPYQAINIKTILETPKYAIEDLRQTGCSVFSIDPHGCTDFDDAVSIEVAGPLPDCYRVTIYIADVPATLDRLNLWDAVSDRVATVYLPNLPNLSIGAATFNAKRTMLPPVLANDVCSLVANTTKRDMLAMEAVVIGGEVVGIQFIRKRARIARNYVYEECDFSTMVR